MAELTRIKGSQPLVANYGYANGEEVRNDFDSKYPYSEIHEVVDDYGNRWVQIPKFYRCMNVENGAVKGRELSEYRVDDNWALNHSFTNNAGFVVNYIEVAKYQMSLDNNGVPCSVPGVYPSRGLTIAQAREAVKKLNEREDGYEYFLYNIWTSQIEQDLFVVEFANSYAPSVISGYPAYFDKGYQMTGTTDKIPYCTGIESENSHNNKADSMKYRHIENIYGNGMLYIDGIYLQNSDIYVSINNETYKSNLPRLVSSGPIHQLGYDSQLDLVFPKNTNSTGSYTDYYDGLQANETKVAIYRGNYSTEGYGLFSMMQMAENTKLNDATYRIVRRLK